jgi:hypothetical protein
MGQGGAPINDNCADAIDASFGANSFSTVGASTDGPPLDTSCNEGFGLNFNNDIWFRVTCELSENLIVSTCGMATFDTRLALYDTCGGTLLACNDDGENCLNSSSLMSYPATAGETYLVRVGGFFAVGTGTLSVNYGVKPPAFPGQPAVEWPENLGGNGHSYANFAFGENRSYEEAIDVAARLGGYPATITSFDESQFVMSFMPVYETEQTGRCTMGLTQFSNSSEPFGGWYWLNGESFDWTNWNGGEPNDNPAPENFSQIYSNGRWNDCVDNEFGSILIEFNEATSADEVTWSTEIGGNGNTYRAVILPDGVTWNQASVFAVDAGGQLASLETEEEGDWVYDNLAGFVALWTMNLPGKEGPWIGLSLQNGSWQWESGEALSWNPWAPGEPNNSGTFAGFDGQGNGPRNQFDDKTTASSTRSFIIEFEGNASDCVADFNNDGEVTGADFGILLGAWSECPGCAEDLNGDGEVSGPDVGLLLALWGPCS